MRVLYITLMMGLLLAMAGASIAQMDTAPMDQDQMDQEQAQANQMFTATVQAGPVVRTGYPRSADVFVNGRFALRVPASAGGLSPMQRAEIIVDRLNSAFESGLSWNDMRVTQVNGLWSVSMDGTLIATADVNSARAYRMQTGALASRWARQTVVALGGQPQMIAMQLEPIPAAVAGEVQELGANWVTSPTKTVPLLNAATGDQIGEVMVAGTTANLDNVNAVVVYESTSDSTVVRTFVPITGTTTTGTLARATGVGVISLPSEVLPMTGIMTGTDVESMITRMATQWNSAINSRLTQTNMGTRGNTKVVPLYSMETSQVIGAAHVVGTAQGIAQTQSVVVSTSGDMVRFSATSTARPTGVPTALTDVVVSSLIYTPMAVTPPTPDVTPPDTGVTPPSPPETTPSAPDEGVPTP